MYANSRPVTSSQPGPHEHLAATVARHLAAPFRKPYQPYNLAAFDAGMAAWRAAGSVPLILDSGCGVGQSTINLARAFPDHFVIGVDQSADRLGRQTQDDAPLPANQIRLRADLVDFWRQMLDHRVFPARHYVLYPNPWPKKDQLGRRWHGHGVFPAMVALGGTFECRSNWRIYIEECAAAIGQVSGLAVDCEAYEPAGEPITPFERKYRDSGHSLWRCRVNLPHNADMHTSQNEDGPHG